MSADNSRGLRHRALAAGWVVCATAVLSASPALANADGDVLFKLGVVGRWAEDCSKPAGAENAYLIYRTPADGVPTEQLIYSADLSRPGTPLRDVRLISPGKLQWTQTDGETTFVIVKLFKTTRLKTWSSIDTTGKVYIRDGAYALASGTAPWFTKCGAN